MRDTFVDVRLINVETYCVTAPFNKALITLTKKGYDMIPVRDNALLRRQKGKTHDVLVNGNFVREGILHTRNSYNLLALNSPLLSPDLAKLAVKANRKEQYFSTGDLKLYEQYLRLAEQDKNKDPKERQVLIIPRDSFLISPKENPEIFEALFKDAGRDYLSFVGQDNLKVYPVDKAIVDKQEGTLLTQLWFRSLDNGSVLYGNIRNLDCGSRARGVRYAEGVAQNLKMPYSDREVKKYFDIVQSVKEGKIPNSKLGKVEEFLNKLKNR